MAIKKQNKMDPEYSLQRVPDAGRQKLIRPLCVWFGYAFGPVAIASAAMITASFKFTETILMTLIGCFILVALSGLMAWMAQREGMTFSLLCRFTWGSKAYKVGSLIIPIGLIGWSSIHLFTVGMFFSRMITGEAGMTGAYYVIVILALLFIAFSAYKGINTVTFIGFFAVPFIILLLCIATGKSIEILGSVGDVLTATPPAAGTMTIAAGVTAMVGSFACGATGGSADVQRFCKKPSHAWIVSFVTFGIAYPFLMCSCAIIAMATGATAFVDAFAALGMLVSGSITVFLLAWSTVNADYYSSSLSFSGAIGIDRRVATLIIAAAGGILALLGSGYFLEYYLTLMTSFMVPIVGIIVSDYFFVNKGKYPEPEVAMQENSPIPAVKWGALLGYAAGVITLLISDHFDFFIPPLNSWIVAAVFHYIGCKIFPQKANFNDLCNEEDRKKSFAQPAYKESNK